MCFVGWTLILVRGPESALDAAHLRTRWISAAGDRRELSLTRHFDGRGEELNLRSFLYSVNFSTPSECSALSRGTWLLLPTLTDFHPFALMMGPANPETPELNGEIHSSRGLLVQQCSSRTASHVAGLVYDLSLDCPQNDSHVGIAERWKNDAEIAVGALPRHLQAGAETTRRASPDENQTVPDPVPRSGEGNRHEERGCSRSGKRALRRPKDPLV